MKTVFHPIITAAEGNENASASILNQNSFFRVIFTFLPVSLDGCTADMDSQWLLKYSLQRTGVKTVSYVAILLLIWINLSPAITAL